MDACDAGSACRSPLCSVRDTIAFGEVLRALAPATGSPALTTNFWAKTLPGLARGIQGSKIFLQRNSPSPCDLYGECAHESGLSLLQALASMLSSP